MEKCFMLTKLIKQMISKSWDGLELSTYLKNWETFGICCNYDILKGKNIGNLPHWHSELMMEKNMSLKEIKFF